MLLQTLCKKNLTGKKKKKVLDEKWLNTRSEICAKVLDIQTPQKQNK